MKSSDSSSSKTLGKEGELLAQKFLVKKGLQLVEKNFHAQGGEIDLIMYDKKYKEYVFVEVKTRTSDSFGDVRSSITPNKLKKIMKAAEHFFFQKFHLTEVPFFRLDAICIKKDKIGKTDIEHFENLNPEGY